MKIVSSQQTIKNVQEQINQLIKQLDGDNSLKEVDKIALKAGMLIGKESYEYWNSKNTSSYEKIRSEFNTSTNTTNNSSKNKYLQADIEGAVGGAITGAFTGGPAGAAIGAMLGAPWSSAVSGFFDQYIW